MLSDKHRVRPPGHWLVSNRSRVGTNTVTLENRLLHFVYSDFWVSEFLPLLNELSSIKNNTVTWINVFEEGSLGIW